MGSVPTAQPTDHVPDAVIEKTEESETSGAGHINDVEVEDDAGESQEGVDNAEELPGDEVSEEVEPA